MDNGCAMVGPVYCEIQQAIDAAATGNEIEVADVTDAPIMIDVLNLSIEAEDDGAIIAGNFDNIVEPSDAGWMEFELQVKQSAFGFFTGRLRLAGTVLGARIGSTVALWLGTRILLRSPHPGRLSRWHEICVQYHSCSRVLMSRL
jgi:hypothetical protein